MYHFLKQFASNPTTIGAITPSSAALAQAMVEWIDWDQVDVVVECGPGTGAITGSVVASMHPDARYIGVELNHRFHELLQERFPEHTFIHDSIENIESICATQQIESVDAIASGLPWASFGEDTQTACLEAMLNVLRPGGPFVTFAYLQGMALPAGQQFRRLLDTTFEHVEKSPIVWRNLPPAFVYRCRK